MIVMKFKPRYHINYPDLLSQNQSYIQEIKQFSDNNFIINDNFYHLYLRC